MECKLKLIAYMNITKICKSNSKIKGNSQTVSTAAWQRDVWTGISLDFEKLDQQVWKWVTYRWILMLQNITCLRCVPCAQTQYSPNLIPEQLVPSRLSNGSRCSGKKSRHVLPHQFSYCFWLANRSFCVNSNSASCATEQVPLMILHQSF